MSIHVLKRKANARAKLNIQNQYASNRGEPFSLNMTGRGTVRSAPVMGEVSKNSCCPPDNFVRKSAKPQSYFNYHRRSLGGLGGLLSGNGTTCVGGLASRVVHLRNTPVNGSLNQMVTYKRSPEFSQSQHINDKKIKEIRCDHKAYFCDPNATPPFSTKNPNLTNPPGSSCLPSYIAPECKNNCGKGRAHITKNLGFMSSGDYLHKKMSFRKMSGNYEEPLMRGSSSRC